MPKKDQKGKVIKNKKGWKPAVSLVPDMLKKEIRRKLEWFISKFKPYSNHLVNTLMARPIGSQRSEEDVK